MISMVKGGGWTLVDVGACGYRPLVILDRIVYSSSGEVWRRDAVGHGDGVGCL